MVAFALVELGLELHPVQTEGVQESTQPFHQKEDGYSQIGPKEENNPENDASEALSPDRKSHVQHHGP